MAIDEKYLIGNTDAVVWAEEFCERFYGFTIVDVKGDDLTIDTAAMIGWFANAIMAGFDEGHARALKEASSTKKTPLGDPTEYEFYTTQANADAGVTAVLPQEVTPVHEYADEDVARLAQQVEDLYDVLGDLLCNTIACEYDDEEWCTVHGVGRPCPFQIARSYLNAK
jgi:hypothetical protein